jgi:hypothetical protein
MHLELIRERLPEPRPGVLHNCANHLDLIGSNQRWLGQSGQSFGECGATQGACKICTRFARIVHLFANRCFRLRLIAASANSSSIAEGLVLLILCGFRPRTPT